MENNIDLRELSIILGLKDNSSQLNKIILDQKELTFIGAISNILYSDYLNDLIENIDSSNDNNEMIDNFIKNAKIDDIGPVKLKLYNNSNFKENIKGYDKKWNIPNLNFSEKYMHKLQNEFIKGEKVIPPPTEIKEQKIENYEDNKKKYKNKKNIKKDKGYKQNQKSKDENIEINAEKGNELEEEKEDKKEIKINDDIEIIDGQNIDHEEIENNEYKKDNRHNQQRSYNRNFPRKYNKNKGHKEFRQKLNSKKNK